MPQKKHRNSTAENMHFLEIRVFGGSVHYLNKIDPNFFFQFLKHFTFWSLYTSSKVTLTIWLFKFASMWQIQLKIAFLAHNQWKWENGHFCLKKIDFWGISESYECFLLNSSLILAQCNIKNHLDKKNFFLIDLLSLNKIDPNFFFQFLKHFSFWSLYT